MTNIYKDLEDVFYLKTGLEDRIKHLHDSFILKLSDYLKCNAQDLDIYDERVYLKNRHIGNIVTSYKCNDEKNSYTFTKTFVAV